MKGVFFSTPFLCWMFMMYSIDSVNLNTIAEYESPLYYTYSPFMRDNRDYNFKEDVNLKKEYK